MPEIATATASSPSPTAQRAEMSHRRTWSFTSKVTGKQVTVKCLPGCSLDHGKDDGSPMHPEDAYCVAHGTAGELPLYGPLCESSSPEDFRVLAWQINVNPFSGKLAQRLPHVNIEAIDDHWIENLDPDTLAAVIGHLQQQVDSLRAAHAQLVSARADYAAEEILTALRQETREVAA